MRATSSSLSPDLESYVEHRRLILARDFAFLAEQVLLGRRGAWAKSCGDVVRLEQSNCHLDQASRALGDTQQGMTGGLYACKTFCLIYRGPLCFRMNCRRSFNRRVKSAKH
jgi:hypothetical protein